MADGCSEELGTYVGEVPGQLSLETIDEAGEETATTSEDHVTHEHLPDLRIACTEGTTDQSRDGFGQVLV